MACYLGLDLGEKRIGLAIADDELRIATPQGVVELKHPGQWIERISELVEIWNPSTIVVGFPVTMKGEIGIAAEKVQKQVATLKGKHDLEWVLWDERLTTAEVERVLLSADMSREKRKEVRDSLAAQRILQSYLDCKRSA